MFNNPALPDSFYCVCMHIITHCIVLLVVSYRVILVDIKCVETHLMQLIKFDWTLDLRVNLHLDA